MNVNFSKYEVHKNTNGSYNLSENSIIFILNGNKKIYCKDWFYELSEGDCILINKNNYVMTEFIKGEKFQSVIINFGNDYFEAFLEKHKINPPKKSENTSKHCLINDYIKNFIQSLSLLDSELRNSELLKLKIEEFLMYLYSHKNEVFRSFHQVFDLSKTHAFSRDIQLNDEFYKLSISEIAFLHHMSESTFKRNFKKIYHTSPKQYFIKERMNLAYQLINQGLSLKEISNKIGYENTSSFSRVFKNFHGFPPSTVKLT